MTKIARYYSDVSAGFRVAREEFVALREAVETERHRVKSADFNPQREAANVPADDATKKKTDSQAAVIE